MFSKPGDLEGFTIRWVKLNAQEYFRLDKERHRILLNQSFRNQNTDDVVKLLLAVMLRADVGSEPKQTRLRELKRLNEILIELAT